MNESMSSAGGSPAKTSASPVKGPGCTESGVASGTRCSESSRRHSLRGSSRKTYQPFALADWTRYSAGSLRSGMTRNGTVLPLPPLVPRTSGTVSGSLPTQADQPPRRMWPTPAHRDFRYPNKRPYSERGGRKKGEQLPNAVGGPLNPPWVEWLMGYPEGWTDLSNSAIQ